MILPLDAIIFVAVVLAVAATLLVWEVMR